MFSPIAYDEPVFRPPSEAYSLILQATHGCSWNRCAFCEMYSAKKFSVKKEAELFAEIEAAGRYYSDVRKVFLADGNAMVLSTARLLRILERLQTTFPKLARVSAYAIPKDLAPKSTEELRRLRKAGLRLIYAGLETGDDQLLKCINKGETAETMIASMNKARDAGIKTSVMIINGLGGKHHIEDHARHSATMVSAIRPDFLSTLVLSFPFGKAHFQKRFQGDFVEMNLVELLMEQYRFISDLQLGQTVFRSDHASNYLVLKGILNRDKDLLLRRIEAAVRAPELAGLRQEWQRGL